MFKKLKEKLAEEVKSSPQRIQQFAQAAQAAVTSASSSISDITNNDLFSIGDSDGQQQRPPRLQPSPSGRQNTFQDVSLAQPAVESLEYTPGQETLDNQRLRRLSNSSLASDVSFRLPSYETPSMYHLQSDMEVSASEAEERGFASGAVSLDRVTKEQLYGAYRRTQERYKEYRTQYGDLARHYKLLERENAKARSVLVETQDKALRRISELKEQCSLEQSAKAHLEKALRIEIEEKNMSIDALNTKVKVLQNIDVSDNCNKNDNINKEMAYKENDMQLINLSNDNETKSPSEESCVMEITNLNNKIEKMEQLLNKYKESLKSSKEKNSQVVTELQIVSNELDTKNKEIDQLKLTAKQLDDAIQKIQELNSTNEDLQNKINTYDFTKTKEMSELEMDLQRAKEEITQLQGKIEVFSKREEEYAISLAENKLSIHKELENKEAEIKSLKDSLSSSQKEVQSLNIIINDYKANIVLLEEEKSKLINDNKEYNSIKSKVIELDSQLQEFMKKCQAQEQMMTKAEEEYKCLQLQLKQETAEKLAMIDRNVYLENKNRHLSEENSKKCSQITALEHELRMHKENISVNIDNEREKQDIITELEMWQSKYNKLESEIQEEREELVKLQSEIEKLLAIHELTQKQNMELKEVISDLKGTNATLQDQISNNDLKTRFKNVTLVVSELHNHINCVSNEAVSLKKQLGNMFLDIERDIREILINYSNKETECIKQQYDALKTNYIALQQELKDTSEHNSDTSKVISSLRDENNNLKSKISKLESEKDLVNESKINVDKLYAAALNNIEALKHEQKELVSKIQGNANKSKNLESALDSEKTNNLTMRETLLSLQNENKELSSNLNIVESRNKGLIEKIEKLKCEVKDNIEKLFIVAKENNELKEKSDDMANKTIYINNLQDNIKVLTDENISLKNQIEKIAGNIKNLEAEITEVRKSHNDMEIEKDRLSSIIETLESKQNNKFEDDLDTKSTQTDAIMETKEIVHKTTAQELSDIADIPFEKEGNDSILTDKEYLRLKNDNDTLKDENRRLQSDVEGLQKYLTKISKENSVLNDKLRHLIANSEHLTENNDFSNDDTQNELLTNKEKIESLLRENSILIEENLELKDQLQSQNYTGSEKINNIDNDLELSNIKEKYKNLVQSNTKTEEKLVDLEQLNRSLSSNVQQVQDKNEKLKMTNEKLERKLDEALVSLRHLHSLQENTELEYLRNILYEYLTGSGMHSVTLAKVLSAIVKFDDSQTQLVLQKEKERQGFLRQLGLI